jgi:hypothetical protein
LAIGSRTLCSRAHPSDGVCRSWMLACAAPAAPVLTAKRQIAWGAVTVFQKYVPEMRCRSTYGAAIRGR